MTAPPLSTRRRTWTVVALLVATFLASLDTTAVGPAMPRIVGELGGLTLYGWVFSAYLLTSTVSTPLYGKLADLVGRKRTFLVGVGLFVAGSVACGAAPTMPVLIGARALQGLGAGAILPVTQTVMGDLFEVEARARVQGIFSLVWGASSVVGPAAGGLLVDHVSWRAIFLANLPVGLVSAILLGAVLRERAPESGGRRLLERLDLAGGATLLVGLSALLVAMMALEAARFAEMAGLLALALVSGAAFVWIERRAREPVVPLELFRDAAIGIPAASGFFVGGVLFGLIAYLPLLLVGVFGHGATQAGTMLIPMSLSWTLATFVGGRLMMRLGYRFTIRLGLVLVAAGALAIVAAPRWPDWSIVPLIAVVGAGMGLVISTFTIAAQDRVPFERRGAVTALMLFTRAVGGTVATAALGLALARLLAAGLAATPEAQGIEPSAIVSGELARLSPSALAAARAALGGALGWVLAAVGGLAVLSLTIGWLYPQVARAERSTFVAPPPE